MISLLLVLDLALACDAPLPSRLPTLARTRRYAITVDTVGVIATVPGTADSVWRVLPMVYDSLKLPIHERDERGRRTGTCWVNLRGRLGTDRLSRFLDCGELRGQSNADRLEVQLVVLTSVRAAPEGGVTLATFVIGSAAQSAGASDRIWCTSNGTLEARIRDAVARAM